MRFYRELLWGAVCCVLLCSGVVFAAGPAKGTPVSDRWYSQTVYLPVHSSVFYGNQKRGPKVFNVAATIVVCNTDMVNPVQITEARYVGGNGKTVRQFLSAAVVLGPLESLNMVVDEADVEGGIGASCIVHWNALVPVTEPVVQAVMIGTQSSQGISFVTEGHVLEGVRE